MKNVVLIFLLVSLRRCINLEFFKRNPIYFSDALLGILLRKVKVMAKELPKLELLNLCWINYVNCHHQVWIRSQRKKSLEGESGIPLYNLAFHRNILFDFSKDLAADANTELEGRYLLCKKFLILPPLRFFLYGVNINHFWSQAFTEKISLINFMSLKKINSL